MRVFLLGILIAASTSLHALGTRRAVAQFGQQTWQSDSGLPQNTVHSVLQTRDGLLWIATEAGLVRFDGLSFRIYDTESAPQFRSNSVNDLREDREGALWISTTAGLLREKAGAFTIFTVADGLPSDNVTSTYTSRAGVVLAITVAGPACLRGQRFQPIPGLQNLDIVAGDSNLAEDSTGQIWIAGSRQVIVLAADASSSRIIPSAAETGELRTLAVMHPGEVWVGGRGGIEIIGEARSTRITVRDHLPSNEVTALQPDGSGGMWIGTSRGLAHWKAGAIAPIGVAEGIGNASVEHLFRDREHTLWVATSRGVARVIDRRVDLLPRPSRLGGVLSMIEDREGSMWFGTDNAGLTVVREQPFSTVGEPEGLSAGFVRAVFQDPDGTIWIGTNGGGLSRIDRGKALAAPSHPALSSDVVLSIARAGRDLWVGTPNGLNRIRNGVLRVFTTEDGLADDFVRSLYADTDASLWIGTRNGLSHLVGGAFVSYSKADGLGSDLIGAILRSRAGDLWIGTLGGLSRWNGSSFVNSTARDGLGANAVTALLEDSRGSLWIGTQGGGLTRLRDNTFRSLPPSRSGLPETIFGLLEDADGDLWFSSRRGVSRVALSDLNRLADTGAGAAAVRIYGAADGMRISEASSGGHPAAWRMEDGSLWFATLDGAAFVNPESAIRNQLPPPTIIEQVLLNEHAVDLESIRSTDRRAELKVPPGERRITVQYAGLSYVAPQKVRYRYRLEGFDKEWVEAGPRREAFYTNVPPGKYRFSVISSNNDGVWSTKPAAFNLRVQPTLLQTKTFYVVLALLLGSLAFAVYRWRVLTVEAQYNAVLQERNRIAREIHDTLAQGYVAISVQLEVTTRLLQTSKEGALKQLEQTRELVRGSLAEARSSIWNLRSPGEVETLPSLLAAMTENKVSDSGPSVKLSIKGTYRPVSRGVEQQFLRIAQEAVTNAVRHARARHVHVTLRYDASVLHLQVTDDGVGFLDAQNDLSGAGHFGLQGMRERAADIGASFAVETSPGQGTTINLMLDPRRAERKDLL